MSLLSSIQHSLYYVRVVAAWVMYVLNKATPYELLAIESGINAAEMCGWVILNPKPQL
jgi:hypothetical protein